MMNVETARHIFQAFREQSWESPLDGLYRDLLQAAIRYARIRTDWALARREERVGMDRERRRAHDRFIDACNILSRNMAREGMDTVWRRKLGTDRKKIGDFACYVHCFLGLDAR